MRIAHIVSTYPPYYGGMGNVVFETIKELSARGHEVRVYTPMYGTEEDYGGQIEQQEEVVKRTKAPVTFGNAAYMPSIGRELDNMDIVHLHYPFFGTANLVRKWKRRNPDKKLVITYHMDNRAKGMKGLFFKYYATFWLPKVLQSADRLIGSSIDYIEASDAVKLYYENKNKWIGLPFGVDIERFKPRQKPESLFSRHKLDIDISTLVFVGGMDEAHYFKGVQILLEAVLLLKKNSIGVQAILVGDGNMRERYELLTKGFGISDRVVFAGRVSDEELPYYYTMGDVTVLPSLNRGEAFGMVLLESMACGVPVIASDLPGVRTVAQDGGMVVPPGDSKELAFAIAAFLKEKPDHMGGMVRQIVEEKYSWGVVVDELERVYKELVGKV